jgi:hypothetical protein
MIVKIKSHKRPAFEKLLQYMLNDKDRLYDKDGRSFVLTHNIRGNSINEWVQQFKKNEQYRLYKRRDNTYVFHEILSWHRDDARKINLVKLEEMAREYIRQRNAKGIYIAVPHFDKNHYHIHICASGIEYKTGKSLRLSKPDLQKLKNNIQKFQIERFPELSNSIVSHARGGKPILSEREFQMKLRTGRNTEKENVIKELEACFKKAASRENLFQLLKKEGLEIYKRGNKITGIIHKNYKFRFSRLGFSDEKMNELNRLEEREKGLRDLRKTTQERIRGR